MQKTNHINFADSNGEIYCYRTNKVTVLNNEWWEEQCNVCPYLNGSAQGDGVECLYHDASNRPFIEFWDAADSEIDAKRQKVKLHVASKEDIDDLAEEDELAKR